MQSQFTRSTTDRMIAGVCGGLARYFNIDPVIVRLVFVVAVLSGVSPLLYVILWIIMPQETQFTNPPALPQQDTTGEWQYDPYTGQKIER